MPDPLIGVLGADILNAVLKHPDDFWKRNMQSLLTQVGDSIYFVWIALFGTAMLSVSLLFGGGHDHDADHDGEANMSLLSFKILWMFTVGFGAAGFFAARSGLPIVTSSLIGISAGVVMGGLGYLLMNFLYKHQGNSVVSSESAVGQFAVVDTAIEPGKIGEVHCTVNGRITYFPARSSAHTLIPAASRVIVTRTIGTMLVVEPENLEP